MPYQVLGKPVRALVGSLWPSHKLRWTPEGLYYALIWLLLLATGIYQQINLVLLITGLAAGPIVGSIFVSASMLRGLRINRRSPRFVFSGEPLTIEYVLENSRRWRDALAITADDALQPHEPTAFEARELRSVAFFPRVPARERSRQSWRGTAPARGRYDFQTLELVTRSPFGLFERRVSIPTSESLIVYPAVGTLTRRWRLVYREATETRRGRRHDRSAQQQEYHGLRDYRPGDSPRWIHWRTTARLGQPMVKEFEQQSEQDLVVLLDPWLPRTKASAEQREVVEKAIRFCATLCLETCRAQGRRLLLGWTGPTPGIRHGPASIKLLHELLESLALLRATAEGQVGSLIDAIPPALLREAFFVIVSTRAFNPAEALEQSTRLTEPSGLRLTGRMQVFDASRGDLDDYIRFDSPPRYASGAAQAQAPGSEPPPTPIAQPSSNGQTGVDGALSGSTASTANQEHDGPKESQS